jgi:hypothetical protein
MPIEALMPRYLLIDPRAKQVSVAPKSGVRKGELFWNVQVVKITY